MCAIEISQLPMLACTFTPLECYQIDVTGGLKRERVNSTKDQTNPVLFKLKQVNYSSVEAIGLSDWV